MEDEICKNCGGIITLFEQACVYQGRIVCNKCDKKLRASLEDRSKAAPVRPADSPLPGRAEAQKLEELLEFTRFQAGPDKIDKALEGPELPAPKPLPHTRKRLRITRSMLLWLSLAGWSLLCLFLIFYVPGRYESELKSSALGNGPQAVRITVEFLIVSFMVLWFLGALVLYIATTFTQKDEK